MNQRYSGIDPMAYPDGDSYGTEKTDWKYDFSSLAHWDNREKIPYIYDRFFYIPQSDLLCCIYSIAEVTMCNYAGFFAVLENREAPRLILNIAEKMLFRDNFSVDSSGKIIFLQPELYDNKVSKIRCPILIIDIQKMKFAFLDTDNINDSYRVVEIDSQLFEIKADELQKSTDKRLNALNHRKIDLRSLRWYNIKKLHNLQKYLSKA